MPSSAEGLAKRAVVCPAARAAPGDDDYAYLCTIADHLHFHALSDDLIAQCCYQHLGLRINGITRRSALQTTKVKSFASSTAPYSIWAGNALQRVCPASGAGPPDFCESRRNGFLPCSPRLNAS